MNTTQTRYALSVTLAVKVSEHEPEACYVTRVGEHGPMTVDLCKLLTV